MALYQTFGDPLDKILRPTNRRRVVGNDEGYAHNEITAVALPTDDRLRYLFLIGLSQIWVHRQTEHGPGKPLADCEIA